MKPREAIQITAGFLLSILAFGIVIHAQQPSVPVTVQYRLLHKILDLDRGFKPLNGNDVMIGIVYQRKFRPSLEVQQELSSLIEKSTEKSENGLRLRPVQIDFLENTDLKTTILQNKIQLLYIAPLRSVSLEQITSVSRNVRVRTFTGVPDYIDQGIAIAIGLKGDKPLIMINLPAAKAEGSNYSSQLLGLARVIE